MMEGDPKLSGSVNKREPVPITLDELLAKLLQRAVVSTFENSFQVGIDPAIWSIRTGPVDHQGLIVSYIEMIHAETKRPLGYCMTLFALETLKRVLLATGYKPPLQESELVDASEEILNIILGFLKPHFNTIGAPIEMRLPSSCNTHFLKRPEFLECKKLDFQFNCALDTSRVIIALSN